MKKSYVLIGLFLIFIISITIIGSIIVTGNMEIKSDTDILLVQSNKEFYFSVYGYSIDNPNVIVNPYGNSPLTALVMFETDNYSEVEINIKSKSGNSDISYMFGKDKYHMIPIYGLYADYDNTVVIKGEGKEKAINIKTEGLPEDFGTIDGEKGNFMFYNGNYPYAIDSDGEVRWYLNEHYYGNISVLSNSSIIIGSDRYDENGNTVSFYKMSMLGKIYNEYVLSGGYYGHNCIYNDNVVVLSDDVLVIDIQTGEVIESITSNNEYDYLGVSDGNIVVGKDGVYYKVIDSQLEEIQYSSSLVKSTFYNDTINYKVNVSERFGNLGETRVSDEKAFLINYEMAPELGFVATERELDRIKVTNNSDDVIYLILDKFMDKRVYEVDDVTYINTTGLNGKYTVYYKMGDTIYKTHYYIEV